MEIVVYAMECEVATLKVHFGKSLRFIKCGVKAKNLDWVKNLTPNDHIINVGVCAGSDIGELFLCNKIISDRSFYPETIMQNKIPQKAIKTIDFIADKKLVQDNPDLLFDQEAAIIFEAASHYIGPHQMSFLKLVSDNGADSNFAQIEKKIPGLMQTKLSSIESFIKKTQEFYKPYRCLDIDENLKKYSELLKCSKTMEARLKNQLRYAQIQNIDLSEFFSKIKAQPNKHEALEILDRLNIFLTQG